MDLRMKDKLIRYIDAGYPIIYINSFEEIKTDSIISSVAGGREVLEWNGTDGFVDFKTKRVIIPDRSLEATLKFLLTDNELERKMLVIKDVHTYLDDPSVIALLKKLSQQISTGLDASVILVSPITVIPKELEKYILILEMDILTQNEIKEFIKSFISEQEMPPINDALLEQMSMAFKGLTEFEIENILALAYSTNGEFGSRDLSLIFDQKQQMIMKSGILEMIPIKERIDDIGGLENLKKWLIRKSKVLKSINNALEFGVDMPKGVLIAGVPGCGKSLSAKATACLFEVPLLRLDMGRLMGKYVGESEANMRKAIQIAEAISPCVLWVDELEKAFAGISGGGSEVTTRLFGTFLTWMQEKSSPAFVLATANDITKLPPELLRKGRFDEIFFVGLPNNSEREKIFKVHINKRRKQDLPNINISELVGLTKGYSGADIEGVVKDGIEAAYSDGKDALTTDYIIKAIKETHSLSEIMREPLEKMTKEYENRKFKNASM